MRTQKKERKKNITERAETLSRLNLCRHFHLFGVAWQGEREREGRGRRVAAIRRHYLRFSAVGDEWVAKGNCSLVSCLVWNRTESCMRSSRETFILIFLSLAASNPQSCAVPVCTQIEYHPFFPLHSLSLTPCSLHSYIHTNNITSHPHRISLSLLFAFFANTRRLCSG